MLRARLYREGASGRDVDAYRAALKSGGSRRATPPVRRSGRRRAPVLAAAAILVAAGIAVAWVLVVRSPVRLRQEAIEEPLSSVPVAVGANERDAFVRALSDGRPAGLTAWLDRHGGLVPGGIGAGTRTRTLERHGTGPGTIHLDSLERRATDQRVTVVLVLSIAANASWVASDATGRSQEQASRQAAGTPSVGAATFSSTTRPGRIVIEVPRQVRWGVAVVFSN